MVVKNPTDKRRTRIMIWLVCKRAKERQNILHPMKTYPVFHWAQFAAMTTLVASLVVHQPLSLPIENVRSLAALVAFENRVNTDNLKAS